MTRLVTLVVASLGLLASAGLPLAASETRSFDLRRINELEHLPPPERAARAVMFLKEEIERPSRPGRALDGNLVDTYDTLAQIVARTAAKEPDAATLFAEYERLEPGRLKEMVGILLVMRGDQRAFAAVLDYFANLGNHPVLRMLAGHALQAVPDARSVPIAARLLDEDAAIRTLVRIYPGMRRGKVAHFYIVREAALDLLKALDKAGISLEDRTRALMKNAVLESPEPPVPPQNE